MDRRPDILQAEQALVAANARIGAAKAVSVPIFTAGTIAGQVRSAEAAQREALAHYRKSVQTAFGETENALFGIVSSRKALDAQTLAVSSLDRYLRLAWRRHEGGYTRYLEVTDAERNLFTARIQLAQSEGEVLMQNVALYKQGAGRRLGRHRGEGGAAAAAVACWNGTGAARTADNRGCP